VHLHNGFKTLVFWDWLSEIGENPVMKPVRLLQTEAESSADREQVRLVRELAGAPAPFIGSFK
jgi:hypothetical protein